MPCPCCTRTPAKPVGARTIWLLCDRCASKAYRLATCWHEMTEDDHVEPDWGDVSELIGAASD